MYPHGFSIGIKQNVQIMSFFNYIILLLFIIIHCMSELCNMCSTLYVDETVTSTDTTNHQYVNCV